MRRLVPVIIVVFIATLATHGKFSISGDEPHYLTIAESLLFDGDLDLENNYKPTGHWYGDGSVDVEQHAARTVDGRFWSVHDIGLPILVLPAYYVATQIALRVPDDTLAWLKQPRGLFAYSIVSLSLIALTAWAITMLIAAFERVGSRPAAIGVGLALALSPPVLSHAFLLFPETPAFALTCVVVWLLYRRESELTVSRVALVLLALGLLPWLHKKFSFFALGLLVLVVQQHWPWLRRQSPRVLVLLVSLALVPHALFHLWTIHWWGQAGGPQLSGGGLFALSGIPTGGIGLLLDRDRGLLAYAPIYLIAPAAWALQWRASRRLLLPILLLFVPMAAFLVWDAGFSPAARFLVPLTPLVALPVVRALDRPIIRGAAIALAIFQAAITAYAWQHPRSLWPNDAGTNTALEGIPGIGRAYESWLPSIVTGDSLARGWLGLAIIAAATTVLVMTAKRHRALLNE